MLNLIREERSHQTEKYGHNEDLLLGFGSSVSATPWLSPYNHAGAKDVEAAFRADYEHYSDVHGQPTWMHLIREEVAELFATRDYRHTVEEAIQVAALCVSLCELLIAEYEGEYDGN